MIKFEYKVVVIWFWSNKKYEEQINNLARDGWEMFFVVGMYHYFRREI